ncbi:hypothetical protein [Streptomyces sp. KL116D]|uniref:hypothetical protein n=1 Tax=Streptomyces sp. KL116D TaxID=3045152 RepID=UPI003557061F
MTVEQLALDCEPDWDDEDDPDELALPNDLRGQRIPYGAHITDIPLTGDLL